MLPGQFAAFCEVAAAVLDCRLEFVRQMDAIFYWEWMAGDVASTFWDEGRRMRRFLSVIAGVGAVEFGVGQLCGD